VGKCILQPYNVHEFHDITQIVIDGEIAIVVLEAFELLDTHKICGRTDVLTAMKGIH
jgi:hypothetical protein